MAQVSLNCALGHHKLRRNLSIGAFLGELYDDAEFLFSNLQQTLWDP